MELNKKELKKIMHSFNSISSRMMRVNYDEYGMVLKKFTDFIEGNPIIMECVNQGNINEYDAASDWDKVANQDGYMFDFGPSVEEESFQIYSILKYIEENIKGPEYAFYSIYRKSKWQDNVKEFNDRVLLVLINNINDYLTGVGIDMGLDENTVWNVSGGQVNVASGNATINATQNKGVQTDELNGLIKSITDNLSGLSKEDTETVVEAVEMIKDELTKSEPKWKIVSGGIKLLAPIVTIANGIPVLAGNIQNFISFVTKCIPG